MDEELDDFLPQGHRLQILTPEEYELLWELPRLTRAEQDLYFSLTPREQLVFNRVRTSRTRVHFLLMLGDLTRPASAFSWSMMK